METKSRVVAVLAIGSTSIRVLVAELSPKGPWQVLDKAGKPITLGRDVFTSGQVSRESLLECLSVLRYFRELLAGWGILDEDIYALATSALRVARNRDVFVDRVRLATGFKIVIVEGIEENRLIYLAVRFALKQDFSPFWEDNTMIIDIGGGATEIMLLERGKMAAAHSLHLGTLLMEQQSRLAVGSAWSKRYLRERIRHTAASLSAEVNLAHIKSFVAVGSDTRIAAALIGTELNEHCRIISREAFMALVRQVQYYSTEVCVQKLHIPYAEAEGLVLGLLVYKQFLEHTSASQVVVPDVSLREGLLIDLALGVEPKLQEEFFSQIIASAANLGRKYHYDQAHNRYVADLCLFLFDALGPEHGMNRRERMMLEVSALLHDIGMFIRGENHHKHGQYIVVNSEIFGLRRDELEIIANVIRYHRGAPPSSGDIDYIALQRADRNLVLKMASLLRVADALDRGHTQQISLLQVERKSEVLVLHTVGNRDLSLELRGLEEKAGLFQDVFGYTVLLV
ncbi:MAG: HD domain-containing protein [Spirochaetaceae bacterium]|jgi:exopolyphosphatase/guanosine-5'-triphosphate,3'-diphosphate pyrophosphatase|nr:HD domain-containing protein [Spirochaetaceae bacterium]